MSSLKVCKNCDSNDIEVDRTRGKKLKFKMYYHQKNFNKL